MRYLRLLTNALAAGILAAAYVIVLILELNPQLPLHPIHLLPLVWPIGIYYAGSAAVIVYAVMLIRQLFGRVALSPAWISVNVIVWTAASVAAAGALLMAANLRTFSLVLEAKTGEIVFVSTIVVAAAAVLLFVMAFVQRYGGRRGVWAAGVIAIVLASVAVPLGLRGGATSPAFETRPLGDWPPVPLAEHPGRVTVIALDAGSLEVIANAAAEGRLPNFGRVLDAGAVSHLATLHPTSAEAVWAAVATGKLPQKNGVRSSAVYHRPGRDDAALQLLPDFCFATGLIRFGILQEEPRTAASIRTRPIWTILGAAGLRVGVVNFPLTQPAPIVNGFLVSDAFARGPQPPAGSAPSIFPADLVHDAVSIAETMAGEPIAPAILGVVSDRYRAGARADRLYDRLYRALMEMQPAQVSFIRYQSPDAIAHYFLRYTMPSQFGDVSDEDRRRYGGVLEAHYALVDEAIGREIETLGPDDLLLVVSGFGIEPLSISKRVLERLIGDPDISGTHEAAPDGFLMAYGASVARARQPRRASVVDVVPTLLYFLGLPVGRDMDGYARTDLFQRSFTDERPITFIPSYDR